MYSVNSKFLEARKKGWGGGALNILFKRKVLNINSVMGFY